MCKERNGEVIEKRSSYRRFTRFKQRISINAIITSTAHRHRVASITVFDQLINLFSEHYYFPLELSSALLFFSSYFFNLICIKQPN